MPPEKAFRKAAKRTPLGYPPLPRLKLEGRLPSPGPESEHKDPAHNVDPRVKPGVVFKKIDYCQSPECIPGLQMPVHAQGLELGLPGMNKKTEQHMPPRYGASPSRNLPKIYLGDNAPTPRWLIRPVKTDEDPPSPRTSQLPPLGRLRWEFEPGLPGQHGQDESRLREYAYQYLQNALCDPIVREELRQMIWDSRYNETIAHVDDPLPVPPPPPHFKDQRPSDYVNLRPPISPSNPDDYHFVYPGYERPSLAARAYDSLTSPESSYAGSYASRSSMGESDGTRTRASTSSSVSTNAKDLLPEYYHHELSEDHHHHIRPNSQSDADTGTDTEAQTKTSSVASPRALASPISTSKNAHPTSGSLLRNPPNRGRGQSKRVYVESPGLDELSSADTETEAELPPRKKKGGKNVPVSSKSTWSPNSTSNSDAFSGIERDKPVSKLPRGKATRKKATGKAAAVLYGMLGGSYLGQQPYAVSPYCNNFQSGHWIGSRSSGVICAPRVNWQAVVKPSGQAFAGEYTATLSVVVLLSLVEPAVGVGMEGKQLGSLITVTP
ncbi:hypothetical protein BDV18DRAFT_156750 [Aspergillus unguis]